METFSFSNWKTVIYYLLCLRSVIYIKAVIFLWFWHIIRFFFTRWRNTSLCLVIWGILVTSCFTIYTTSDKTTLFNFYIWLETTHYNLSNFHLIICISFSRMLPEKKAFVFFFNLGVSGKYSFLLNYDPLWVEASYIAYYIIGLYCAKVSINCILSLLLNWFLSVFIMTVYVLFDVLCTKTTQQSTYYKALKLTPTLVWNIRPII